MANVLGAGGEEWQNFEQQTGYDPNCWTDVVASAKGRIDELRRRDVTITLTDRQGQPVANREITIEQIRNGFDWGHCGWGYLTQMQDGSFNKLENMHVREMRTKLYNSINLMHYWAEIHCTNAPVSEEYQGRVDYEVLDAMVNWARGHGLKCKGHPLYWGVPKAIPPWLLKYDVATRRKFLEVRVRQITSRFKGRIEVYDAQNEMLWEPNLAHTEDRHWPHIEPIELIADENAMVMGWARDEDPDACYLINEYGICRGETDPIPMPTNTGGQISRDQQLDRFIALGKALVDRGQAPDAMGVQCPPGSWGDLPRLVATYDDLGGGTGLPVHITEFRTGTKHLEKAGLPDDEIMDRLCEYLEALLTISFGNPHCAAFWFWSDGYLLEKSRRPSKAYALVDRLVNQEWMTRQTLTTDAKGTLRFRGYYGDYVLRSTRAGGHVSGQSFQVPAATVGGLTLNLRLGAI